MSCFLDVQRRLLRVEYECIALEEQSNCIEAKPPLDNNVIRRRYSERLENAISELDRLTDYVETTIGFSDSQLYQIAERRGNLKMKLVEIKPADHNHVFLLPRAELIKSFHTSIR